MKTVIPDGNHDDQECQRTIAALRAELVLERIRAVFRERELLYYAEQIEALKQGQVTR